MAETTIMADRIALCRYHYDPLDRLASRTPLAQTVARQFYVGTQLATELQGNEQRSFFRTGNQLLAQQNNTGSLLSNALTVTDLQGSVLNAVTSATHHPIAYSAYGHRPTTNPLPGLPGFNGEQPDPQTGHYLLGNGYRAFNPVLMRFNSPDSLSPFSGGGLNPYTYCLGDPINRTDPAGHLSWQAGLGFGLSALGIVLSIVSFGAATPLAIAGLATGLVSGGAGIAQAVTEESAPGASSILGWVSLGAGVASAGFGLAAGFQKVAGHMYKKLHRPLSSGGTPNPFSTRPESAIQVLDSYPPISNLGIQESAVRNVAQNMRGNQLIKFMELSDYFKETVPRHLRTSAVSGHADMLSAESIHRLRRIALGKERGYLPSQVLDYKSLKLMTQELPRNGVFEVEFEELIAYFRELRRMGRA